MHIAWVDKFNIALTKRRLSYAWIAGGALWVAWILSVFTGTNGFDLAGQVIGTDYIQFYAAGNTLLRHESKYLYDFIYQSELEREIIGPGLTNFHAFITPPLFAALFIPLSILPYPVSFAFWSLLGLFLLGISVVLLTKQHRWEILKWSLIWFPVFATISFGQNSLISLFVLSLVYVCWIKKKYFLCGLAAGLLFYKPQLAIGVLLLFILEFKIQRRAIAGYLLAILIIILLNISLFPEASLSYLSFVIRELPSMISQDQFPIWHMHTIRGFWMMILGKYETFAEVFNVVCIGIITIYFIKYYQRYKVNRVLIFSAVVCLTLLITPHAMIYDWTLLVIPAILLWEYSKVAKPLLVPIFSIMWIVSFISGPLAYIQLSYLPIAIQISVPIFIFSVWYVYYANPSHLHYDLNHNT